VLNGQMGVPSQRFALLRSTHPTGATGCNGCHSAIRAAAALFLTRPFITRIWR
jgi:hypothetical protein